LQPYHIKLTEKWDGERERPPGLFACQGEKGRGATPAEILRLAKGWEGGKREAFCETNPSRREKGGIFYEERKGKGREEVCFSLRENQKSKNDCSLRERGKERRLGN